MPGVLRYKINTDFREKIHTLCKDFIEDISGHLKGSKEKITSDAIGGFLYYSFLELTTQYKVSYERKVTISYDCLYEFITSIIYDFNRENFSNDKREEIKKYIKNHHRIVKDLLMEWF